MRNDPNEPATKPFKRKIGRPRTWPDELLEDFGKSIQEYLENNVILSMVGLQNHLGFISYEGFIEQEKRPGFSESIKWARGIIEQQYVEDLHTGNGSSAGCIFILSNNFKERWKNTKYLGGDSEQPLIVEVIKYADDVVSDK